MLSIFANRAQVREEMREDAEQAGFVVREAATLARLLEDGPLPYGEVLLVDCPEVSERGADALARLDEHAARTGTQLVLSTTLAALDAVYAACARSEPQILVNSTRTGRVIALGMILAADSGSGVRELSEADRLTLLRLTEQVGMIAQRLDRFGEGSGGAQFPSLEQPAEVKGNGGTGERPTRSSRPPLPDPRLVRRMIQHRQARAKYFDGELFADPAWDMLLDLTAARAEHVRVSVTSLCIAASVPPTTALRWISQMTKAGMLERVEDDADKRRAFIALSDRTAEAMARYFADLGAEAAQVV
jgi:hypothetical protein